MNRFSYSSRSLNMYNSIKRSEQIIINITRNISYKNVNDQLKYTIVKEQQPIETVQWKNASSGDVQ